MTFFNAKPTPIIRVGVNRYICRVAIAEVKDTAPDSLDKWSAVEVIVDGVSMDAIKTAILAWYNEQIDERILSGFVWKDMKVWLSSENQFNYKAAYDLAVQNGGANLPITFKFGTTNEPVYHTFTTVEELNGFYLSAMKYINDTLAAGWAEKDAIDWNAYDVSKM